MSVLLTESFMRFDRRYFDPGTEPLMNPDLVAGDIEIVSYASGIAWPPSSPGSASPVMFVGQDPVFANRNSLKIDTGGGAGSSRGCKAAFTFDQATSHYIAGFRLRLGVLNPNHSNGMYFVFGPKSLVKHTSSGSTEGAALPLNTWMTAAAIGIQPPNGFIFSEVSGARETAPVSYTSGTDVYVEVEIDTDENLVRVWVDDLLVLDTAFAGGDLATAKAEYDQGFCFYVAIDQAGSTRIDPTCDIRDVYCLKVDAVEPFTRLGATAQVVGERPGADVQAEFARPGGYGSNAEVVSLPVEPDPGVFVTADTIGQQDMYSVPSSDLATVASQVYAVGIKAYVSNFAASAHSLSAVVKSDTTEGEQAIAAMDPVQPFSNFSTYFTTNPDTGLAWTPGEVADAEFGLKVTS